MEHAFGLYCLMRRQAVPGQEQPVFVQHVKGHVPREMHRQLQARGVHSGAVHPAVELHSQATERLQRRWEVMLNGAVAGQICEAKVWPQPVA